MARGSSSLLAALLPVLIAVLLAASVVHKERLPPQLQPHVAQVERLAAEAHARLPPQVAARLEVSLCAAAAACGVLMRTAARSCFPRHY